MIELTDLQAEAIYGASGIVVAPSISITTSLNGLLQTNGGASVVVGVLGGTGIAGLVQGTGIKFLSCV
jgi:hypothetical protein